MEFNLSLVPEESEFSFDSEEEAEKKPDHFQSTITTWANRYHCLQAYCCFVLSYMSTLKFCLTVGEYGFVILIPYWVSTVLYGMAASLVEIQIGRYVIGNVARAWNMCPISRGILWCLFGTTFFTIMHDHLSNAVILKYLFLSFRGYLPWETCDSSWADSNCYRLGHKTVMMSKCLKNHTEEYCHHMKLETSGRQFWRKRIIATDATSVLWSVFALFISVSFSLLVNYKGIRSIEKLLPIVLYPTLGLWLLLSCVTFTIPHSIDGLTKLWSFRWATLFEVELWVDSFRDVVYILGLGKLTLSFISSHGKFNDNILTDVLIASFGGLFSCVLITTPILSVIKSIRTAEELSVTSPLFHEVDDVFVYTSEALTLYPFPKALWAILSYMNWFLMTTSAQSMSVLAFCEALAGLLKTKGNFLFCIITLFSVLTFCVGILFVFFPVLFLINVGTTTVAILLLSTITWQQGYGIWKFNKDYYFMMGRPLPIFVKGCWINLCLMPATATFCKLAFNWHPERFPGILYYYIGIPIFVFFTSMAIQMYRFKRNKRSIFEVFRPNPEWGPQNPVLRKSRIVFDSNTASKEMLYRQELCNRPFTKPPDFTDQNIVQLI